MRSRLTLHALALTGILAVSGVPAFAADVTAASPQTNATAPSASVSRDGGATLGTGAKASAETNKAVAAKKVEKTKAATAKKTGKTATAAKTHLQQTAQRPAAPAGANGSANVNATGGNDAVGAGSSVGATAR